MRWTIRLQERLAITRGEALALAVVGALYLSGALVRYVQQQARTVPDSVYADFDRMLKAGERADSVKGEAAPATVSLPDPVRIDLNEATQAQLERLPRIGPTLAARIVAYREAHGTFRRVGDLTRVSGIGEKTLAQLEPLLYVGPPP